MVTMSHEVVLLWRAYYALQDRFDAARPAYAAALARLNLSHRQTVAGSAESDSAEGIWSRVLWARNVERDQLVAAWGEAQRAELHDIQMQH